MGGSVGKARSDDFTRPGARRGIVCADIALLLVCLPCVPVSPVPPIPVPSCGTLLACLLPPAKAACCVVGNCILLPHMDLGFLSACMLSSCTEISLSFCVSLFGNAGSNYLTEVAGGGEEPGVSVDGVSTRVLGAATGCDRVGNCEFRFFFFFFLARFEEVSVCVG